MLDSSRLDSLAAHVDMKLADIADTLDRDGRFVCHAEIDDLVDLLKCKSMIAAMKQA